MKIKSSEIPKFRDLFTHEQNGLCKICQIDLSGVVACLDHDHESGMIRGVLCNNCNGIEGKISNLARRGKRNGTKKDFLLKILKYWESEQKNIIHPNFKTKDEKRILKNKRARIKRKKQS